MNLDLYNSLPLTDEESQLILQQNAYQNHLIQRNKGLFQIQSPVHQYEQQDEQNNSEMDIFIEQLSSEDYSSQHIQKELQISVSKKIVKQKKSKQQSRINNGPLSKREFFVILKKLEQCQQVKQILENLENVLNKFKMKLVQDLKDNETKQLQ